MEVLEQLAEDTSAPRNIRRGATDAKDRLLRKDEALDVRVASAIMILDDLANDPNIPLHGRTQIWNLISQLETVKEAANWASERFMRHPPLGEPRGCSLMAGLELPKLTTRFRSPPAAL